METIQSIKSQIAQAEQHLVFLRKMLEELESEQSCIILNGDVDTAYIIDKTTKQPIRGTAIAPNQVKVPTAGLRDGYYKAKSLNPDYRVGVHREHMKDIFQRFLVKSGVIVAFFDSKYEIEEYEKIHGFQDPDRIKQRQDLLANPRKLEGTPKQVKWAEDIRMRIIAKFKNPDDIPLVLLKETSAGMFINCYRRQYCI